jgi:hypothetical protein
MLGKTAPAAAALIKSPTINGVTPLEIAQLKLLPVN